MVEVGASIGIARSPRDGVRSDGLLHCADVAMYRAKADGRGSFCFFEESMDAAIRDQAALENDLRRAIAEGVIEPYYQPLVALADRSLTGFEALARWHHPERGFVGPDVFIPIAEKLGLISELSYALIAAACRDAVRWPADLTLSVNLSATQLVDPLLPMNLLAILSKAGFPPSRLEVEITESALVRDLATAKAALTTLQGLGIRIALDDFGTGYSSMYHLRELHFDKIKIDRSFIQSLDDNPESGRIVNAILGLTRSLGLQTTAEGIEDNAALTRMVESGCEFGQGFYFGRAMPAPDAAALIAERKNAGRAA
jgi:predicted signal transduction protein with EAL and GGDEF domain